MKDPEGNHQRDGGARRRRRHPHRAAPSPRRPAPVVAVSTWLANFTWKMRPQPAIGLTGSRTTRQPRTPGHRNRGRPGDVGGSNVVIGVGSPRPPGIAPSTLFRRAKDALSAAATLRLDSGFARDRDGGYCHIRRQYTRGWWRAQLPAEHRAIVVGKLGSAAASWTALCFFAQIWKLQSRAGGRPAYPANLGVMTYRPDQLCRHRDRAWRHPGGLTEEERATAGIDDIPRTSTATERRRGRMPLDRAG